MAHSPILAELMTEILGKQSLRQVGVLTGCDAALLSSMRKYGYIPSRSKIEGIAAGLELAPELRARLFYAAGYVDRGVDDDQAVCGAGGRER